jgi:hypothetical protein
MAGWELIGSHPKDAKPGTFLSVLRDKSLSLI